VVIVFVLACLFAVNGWDDSAPTWLGGIGGILGGFASLYALTVALRTAEEHVTWSKVVVGRGKKGNPSKFEFFNVSKATIARVTDVADVTGDSSPALDFEIKLPVDVAPGASLPASLSRTLGNSSPTVVRITWAERPITRKRFGRSERTQTLWL
jgi:hypothetical protein